MCWPPRRRRCWLNQRLPMSASDALAASSALARAWRCVEGARRRTPVRASPCRPLGGRSCCAGIGGFAVRCSWRGKSMPERGGWIPRIRECSQRPGGRNRWRKLEKRRLMEPSCLVGVRRRWELDLYVKKGREKGSRTRSLI